jgi:hypothetical protein
MANNKYKIEYSTIIGNEEHFFNAENKIDAIKEFTEYCENIKDEDIPEMHIIDLEEYVYINNDDAAERLEDVIEHFITYRYNLDRDTEIFFNNNFKDRLSELLKECIGYRHDRRFTEPYIGRKIIASYNLFDRELV